MSRLFTVCAFFAFLACLIAATCPAHGQAIQRAYCGEDASLHILYADGTTATQPKEPHQVGCDSVITADAHTVGWSVLIPSCCTSYPIAVAVAVLQDHRKRVISADQMVWKWRFVNNAETLAILSGPTHGNAAMATLYDLHTGRSLARWNGDGPSPQWASGWKEEFGPPATAETPPRPAK